MCSNNIWAGTKVKEYQLYRKGLLEIYQSDFDLFVAEQSLNEMEKLAKP